VCETTGEPARFEKDKPFLNRWAVCGAVVGRVIFAPYYRAPRALGLTSNPRLKPWAMLALEMIMGTKNISSLRVAELFYR